MMMAGGAFMPAMRWPPRRFSSRSLFHRAVGTRRNVRVIRSDTNHLVSAPGLEPSTHGLKISPDLSG